MFALRSHSKVRADHLTRAALIYIRQSTLRQVRENTASTARQYQLTRRVQELGWPEHLIVVIDQDQGQSGASAVGRTGFEYLSAEVGLGRARARGIVWRPLRHARVLSMLHNPFYAGAYVYGRTKSRTRLLPGEAPRIKARSRRVPRVDWPIVLRDHHVGYLSWEQFVGNLRQLDANRTYRAEERRGAVRAGSALLQGLVVCGRCGRRMTVRYREDGVRPIYVCAQVHKDLAGQTCQFLRGDGLDQAVAHLFLAAMQPAHLQVSLATLAQLEERARAVARQWQLRLERARYDVDLARRRYVAVEPENRLVAATSSEGSEPFMPFVFLASQLGRRLPSDPASRRRPCL
jgi:Recombinase zinc beta ribbon domain/Recombinase